MSSTKPVSVPAIAGAAETVHRPVSINAKQTYISNSSIIENDGVRSGRDAFPRSGMLRNDFRRLVAHATSRLAPVRSAHVRLARGAPRDEMVDSYCMCAATGTCQRRAAGVQP